MSSAGVSPTEAHSRASCPLEAPPWASRAYPNVRWTRPPAIRRGRRAGWLAAAMEGLSARVRATLAASGPDGADGLRRAVQRLGSCATGGASSASDAGGSSTAAAVRDRLLGGTLPPFEQFLPAGWSPPVLRSLEPQMMVRGRVVSVRPVGAVVLLLHAWPPGVLPSDSLAAEASPGAQTRPMDRTNSRGVVQRAERNGAASEGAPAGLDLSRARVVALLHTSRVVPEGTLLADGCEVTP